MTPCVVCAAAGQSEVWGYPVCRQHEGEWRADVVPPAEHTQAGEVPHEALCVAWKLATRAFLGALHKQRKVVTP